MECMYLTFITHKISQIPQKKKCYYIFSIFYNGNNTYFLFCWSTSKKRNLYFLIFKSNLYINITHKQILVLTIVSTLKTQLRIQNDVVYLLDFSSSSLAFVSCCLRRRIFPETSGAGKEVRP